MVFVRKEGTAEGKASKGSATKKPQERERMRPEPLQLTPEEAEDRECRKRQRQRARLSQRTKEGKRSTRNDYGTVAVRDDDGDESKEYSCCYCHRYY